MANFPRQIRWDLRGMYKYGGYVDGDPTLDFENEGIWDFTQTNNEGLLVEMIHLYINIHSGLSGVGRIALLYGDKTDVDPNAGTPLTYPQLEANNNVIWYRDIKNGMIISADLYKLTANLQLDDTNIVLALYEIDNVGTEAPIVSGIEITREIRARIFDGTVYDRVLPGE